ncbi:VPS26 [Lepeophtheirus salmonis]|uniref:VPS26 n=1 Tax=Lepeophtheirus salmonis TaxID=72036 RepID=A0A7R8H913_LEPSM|nr:VPS26 [Lepeophtheirus salmonis]CAF2949218.1 VPS26 [Lepeophtheirus salmonis]
MYYDRGNHHEFLSLCKDLVRPGELTQNNSFDFEFSKVENKPYECYTGANVRLRYFLRVTIIRRLTDITKEMNILSFEYNKSKYHLKDVIVGKIYFFISSYQNKVYGNRHYQEGIDWIRGESIPIRVFLAGYDLTPTMREKREDILNSRQVSLIYVMKLYYGEKVIKCARHLSTHQNIPHAMARHFPAGKDTIVRTAPTPTSPSSDDLAATFGAPEITTNTTTTNNSSTTSNNNNNNILANPTATVIPNTHLVRGHSSSEEIEEVESEPEFLEKEVAVPLPISNNEHEESDENENNNNTSSSVLVPEEKNEDRNVSKSPLTTSDPHE